MISFAPSIASNNAESDEINQTNKTNDINGTQQIFSKEKKTDLKINCKQYIRRTSDEKPHNAHNAHKTHTFCFSN